MTTARFHLGDVLSVTTGKLLSPSGVDGLYRIAAHLAGEPVWTHQLPRVMNEGKGPLLARYPALAQVNTEGVNEHNFAEWLALQVSLHGEWFEVDSLDANQHESIDPESELVELGVHPDRIAVVGAAKKDER